MSEPRYRCDACDGEITVAGRTWRAENLDGTSGDAAVVPFTCAGCGKRFQRWRVPRLVMGEDGKPAGATRDFWTGGSPTPVS